MAQRRKNGGYLEPEYLSALMSTQVHKPIDSSSSVPLNDPWVVLGDFNDVLEQEERVGSRVQSLNSHAFKDCISYCLLEDIKSSGKFFTWCNNQQGGDRIYSKLDRVMANAKWMDLWLGVKPAFF
uniref:Uncharacterized protein n=1 Tax=Cannabis sativa TaxID=3483 RepID=A0A803PQ68_CANSA